MRERQRKLLLKDTERERDEFAMRSDTTSRGKNHRDGDAQRGIFENGEPRRLLTDPITRDITAAKTALTKIHQKLPAMVRTFGVISNFTAESTVGLGKSHANANVNIMDNIVNSMRRRYTNEFSSIQEKLNTIGKRLGVVKKYEHGEETKEMSPQALNTVSMGVSLREEVSLPTRIYRIQFPSPSSSLFSFYAPILFRHFPPSFFIHSYLVRTTHFLFHLYLDIHFSPFSLSSHLQYLPHP